MDFPLGLTINLNALADNYQSAKKLAPLARTACVIKANAYGLGVEKIAPLLKECGADIFFTATSQEAIQARQILGKESTIYVFNGLDRGADLSPYHDYRLSPCLCHRNEISLWRNLIKNHRGGAKSLPKIAFHIDSGINRLGLRIEDIANLPKDLIPDLIISHLACADQMLNPMNHQQKTRFDQARGELSALLSLDRNDIDASLTNSAGLFLGADFAYQITRPGIALYGGDPQTPPSTVSPFKPVVYWFSHITQIYNLKANDPIGYGAHFRAEQDMTIAIIPIGYADGYPRATQKGVVYINGGLAPIIGAISMDMIAINISQIDNPKTGDRVELLGAHISLAELARRAQTIPHNIATGLGRRPQRHYIHQ